MSLGILPIRDIYPGLAEWFAMRWLHHHWGVGLENHGAFALGRNIPQ